ncbi:MAG: squalene/phytoene synthase family protein [Solirubrobacteraceae bacterium]
MMGVASLQLSLPEVPSASAVMKRIGGENFRVAGRVLKREHREGLLAIYGFARLTDEIGDEIKGDRLAALDWLEGELDRAYAGQARHPLLCDLQGVLAKRPLPREPFVRLIEANRLDQRVGSYQTWEQLERYCELSANPVGELVLGVFGLATRERIALSDRVCTALQLIEHLQDLGEDMARGRNYLPERDRVRFASSQEGLYETVAFETRRARELLSVGISLVASVPGRAKLAVAGFVAGGEAAIGEIERARYEVLGGVPQASAWCRGRALWRVLARSTRWQMASGSGV